PPDVGGLGLGQLARRGEVAPGELLQGAEAVLVTDAELAEPLPEHAELPAGGAGRRPRLVIRLRRGRLRFPGRRSPSGLAPWCRATGVFPRRRFMAGGGAPAPVHPPRRPPAESPAR